MARDEIIIQLGFGIEVLYIIVRNGERQRKKAAEIYLAEQ
jgi:hypothetical protein